MAGLQIEFQPVCEPVALADVKHFLRVTIDEDDGLIGALISAAREYCEEFTNRKFINTGLIQSLDSFPYFTDTIMSQMAYPPSYYSLPRYSTTLWNYSQMIKLYYSRLARGSTSKISYVASSDLDWHTLVGTDDIQNRAADFLADVLCEPPRLFPQAGMYWPSVLYVPNAVQIHYAAGYNWDSAIAAALAELSPPIDELATDAANCTPEEAQLRQADVPARIKIAINQLVAFWYEAREPLAAAAAKSAPNFIDALLWSFRVEDYAPTRG
jgi:hypothetical protein